MPLAAMSDTIPGIRGIRAFVAVSANRNAVGVWNIELSIAIRMEGPTASGISVRNRPSVAS